MKTFYGTGDAYITSTIIADSISTVGKRITTFVLEYPRFIHSEFMTHRLFSRNAASSRAIPIAKMIELVKKNPAMPAAWGSNQPGMVAGAELEPIAKASAKGVWLSAMEQAVSHAAVLGTTGAHKQICNRVIEPFQIMKTIMTTTETANWFWLRDHTDADPTIDSLAKTMSKCLDESKPTELKHGEWHLPYIDCLVNVDGVHIFKTSDGTELSLADALKVSASCCAQVSYRNLNDSTDKAIAIYDRLVSSDRVHASPTEHQATPVPEHHNHNLQVIPDGVTHIDRNMNMWSGNFCGWIQHRQLINNNAKW